MKWRWTLLIFELVLLAVILVLPQVDLPDFVVRGGTAPVAAWTRPHSPSQPAIAMVLPSGLVSLAVAVRRQANQTPIVSGPVCRLALLCTLIC
jgi:hypothetical protein